MSESIKMILLVDFAPLTNKKKQTNRKSTVLPMFVIIMVVSVIAEMC